ncbi:hypothetical protein V2G26_008888 [Clonostachys chloroleuca]
MQAAPWNLSLRVPLTGHPPAVRRMTRRIFDAHSGLASGVWPLSLSPAALYFSLSRRATVVLGSEILLNCSLILCQCPVSLDSVDGDFVATPGKHRDKQPGAIVVISIPQLA